MGSRSGKSSPRVSSMENNHKEPFVIGVAGGAASGKTTVCDIITQQLLHGQQIIVLSQESFYYGLSEKKLLHVNGYNFDHPDAFDTERLLSCLKSLMCGNETNIPNYDFKTNEKVFPERKVSPSDVIILEGILVFHDLRLRELMNMKIFVDTDADVRLAQRIHRDTVEKGRAVTAVLEQYSKFVKPAFEDFIAPTKKYADIIIPWGRNNQVAIDLIVQHIQTKLGQHDICKFYSNLYVIRSTFQSVHSFDPKRLKSWYPDGLCSKIRGMLTIIRDAKTSKHDFIFYADRLIRLVVENGLGHLPFKERQVRTPTGAVYTGVEFCRERLCGISVIRSGESMENALRACCKGIKIGKILIHKDAEEGEQLIYQHLPKDIAEGHVLLLDPILATGNSAVQAISLLLERGVQESNIIFLNLISAPEGIHAVCKKFPRIKIVTSEIELGLNDDCHVIPGMGEFGDRYFGTV